MNVVAGNTFLLSPLSSFFTPARRHCLSADVTTSRLFYSLCRAVAHPRHVRLLASARFFKEATARTTKLRGITLSNFITIALPPASCLRSFIVVTLCRVTRGGEGLGGFDRWN